jgi:hypothetical protein
LTLNHPSLIYQEEKKKWAMARVREEVQITGISSMTVFILIKSGTC